jgi:hypothetical protein
MVAKLAAAAVIATDDLLLSHLDCNEKYDIEDEQWEKAERAYWTERWKMVCSNGVGAPRT